MKSYFVLYERQVDTEKEQKYGDKMCYNACRYFRNPENARKFFMKNLPAILAQSWPITRQDKSEIKESEKPYVVAAEFFGKYYHSAMGESDAIKTFDALRCSEADLESVIEKFTREEPEKVFVGVELKLLGGSK